MDTDNDGGSHEPDKTGPVEVPVERWWEKLGFLLLGLGLFSLIFVAVPALFIFGFARINEAQDTDWGNLASVAIPGSVTFTADAGVVQLTYIDHTIHGEGRGIGDIPTQLLLVDGDEIPIDTGFFKRTEIAADDFNDRRTFYFYGEAELPQRGEYQLTVEHNAVTQSSIDPAVHIGTTPPPTTDSLLIGLVLGIPILAIIIGAPIVVASFQRAEPPSASP